MLASTRRLPMNVHFGNSPFQVDTIVIIVILNYMRQFMITLIPLTNIHKNNKIIFYVLELLYKLSLIEI